MTRILVLGGTSEASALARALAEAGIEAVLSYAGRTRAPAAQPLPVRVGGFGGPQGLADWLRAEQITHLVDATHPFAAQISRNAVAAARAAGVPLIALERPAWQAGPGDRWVEAADTEAAVAALPDASSRIFLAIGRQTLAPFAARPDHLYLLRLVDPPEAALPLPRSEVVVARGPFDLAGDTALLRERRIDLVVAKNAGGAGARAKLDAARALGLPVVMIARPALPARQVAGDVAQVMRWLGHHPAAPASARRGE